MKKKSTKKRALKLAQGSQFQPKKDESNIDSLNAGGKDGFIESNKPIDRYRTK
jgi:hypothetical protein